MNGLFLAVISEPWQFATLLSHEWATFGRNQWAATVAMTSLNRSHPYSYMNNPTNFGEDPMWNTGVIVFTDR